MKITSSAVNMAAASKLTQTASKQMHLEYWVGSRNSGMSRDSSSAADRSEISTLARKLSRQASISQQSQPAAGTDTSGDAADGLTDKDKQTIQIIDEFLYRLTGKHFKFRHIDASSLKNAQNFNAANANKLDVANAQPVQRSAGYGLIYDYSQNADEKQQMSFKASGTVQTADGRSIDFSVALNMSREFQSSSELHIRAGDAKVDPLVINLSGGAPILSQRDFSFDIDNDGDKEQISRLMSGSGFLALDKNGDGVINNGGELFGPTMGNGFQELKTYDADGNNWIDENDPVYDKLRIWTADEQGNMQLMALGQAGVGALYLGNVSSSFDINDAANNSLGTVQSTGVFLKEDGGAGTMQHIDLTV